jgi:FkbM family methyltransferase
VSLRSSVIQRTPRRWLVAVNRHPRLKRILRRAGSRSVPVGIHEVELPVGPCRGARMTIDFTYNERYLWLGTYEPWVAATLPGVLDADTVLWDIGANIGYYLIFAGRHSGRRHLAVEADPANIERLVRHLRDNGVAAEVLEAAVAAAPGRVRFSTADNAALSRLAPGHAEGGASREVEAVTLDSLLEGRPPPTLVMMDIEGAEMDALRGAERLLHEVRPAWLVELHGPPGLAAYRTLLDAGYDVAVSGPRTPVDEQVRTHRVHILATPR